MAFNIGVNVLEVDGRAAPRIAAAPTGVAGFLIRSQRGIPNLAVPVNGFGDVIANFGSYEVDAQSGKPLYGVHALRGFFDNGGAQAYVVRVVGVKSAAASTIIKDRASPAVNTLKLTAGMRGQEDPGKWGNSLQVAIVDHPQTVAAIPVQVSGNIEPFKLADGQTLEVDVNGESKAATLTIRAVDFPDLTDVPAAALARFINRQTTLVRASVSTDRRLMLVATSFGLGTSLRIGGTAATALGFTGTRANTDGGVAAGSKMVALQTVAGLKPGSAVCIESRGMIIAPNASTGKLSKDAGLSVQVAAASAVVLSFKDTDFVGGLAKTTPSELVVAINRQAVGFSAALTTDKRISLIADGYGPSSSISIAAPAPPLMDGTTDLGFNGAKPASGVREYRAVEQVAEPSKLIAWPSGTGTAGFSPQASRLSSVEFDVVVTVNGVEVERFESLSMQQGLESFVGSIINDAERGSRYVTVTDLGSSSGVGLGAPAAGIFTLGTTTAGSDGQVPSDAAYLGDPAKRTGLYAFDPVAIQLLTCPESTARGVVAACLSYCEERGDSIYVGCTPSDYGLDGIKDYASSFRGRKVFGALYAPWIDIVNPVDSNGLNPRLRIPPVGHVLGVYARVSDSRGVWKAPAGDEANLRNVLGIAFDMTDTEHTDLVKSGGVNGIRAIAGSGIIVDSSRTLSTDSRWLFVNVRRLFNFVKTSLREGLRWVSQEPHSGDLERMVKFNVITPFLLGLWRQGAFGSDPAEKVFAVKCDAENNPPAQVDQGIFTVDVTFYPVKPAETIVIVVGQQDSGASTAES